MFKKIINFQIFTANHFHNFLGCFLDSSLLLFFFFFLPSFILKSFLALVLIRLYLVRVLTSSCLFVSFLVLRKTFLVFAKSFRAFSHSSLNQADLVFFRVGMLLGRVLTVLSNISIEVSASNEVKVVTFSLTDASLFLFVSNNS